MPIIDVRHEPTAVFAAEAIGKLTRKPGLAVLTAGPGCHQRRQSHRPGELLRIAARRRRRPRTQQPLGIGQPAGARPAADRRERLEVGSHGAQGRRHRAGPRRGVHARRFVAPRPDVRRRTDGRVLQRHDRHHQVQGQHHRPDRARLRTLWQRSPSSCAQSARPVLVLGTDVWADHAEEAALQFVEETGHRGHRQRHGPRHHPRRPPAAGDQGPLDVVQPGRPGDRRRHAARLPPRLRHLRRQGRRDAGQDGAHRRLPRPGLDPCRDGRVRQRRPDLGLQRRASPRCTLRPSTARRPTGRRGSARCRTRSPRRRLATTSCSRPRPTRSTRRASTASCCRDSPTTPS